MAQALRVRARAFVPTCNGGRAHAMTQEQQALAAAACKVLDKRVADLRRIRG